MLICRFALLRKKSTQTYGEHLLFIKFKELHFPMIETSAMLNLYTIRLLQEKQVKKRAWEGRKKNAEEVNGSVDWKWLGIGRERLSLHQRICCRKLWLYKKTLLYIFEDYALIVVKKKTLWVFRIVIRSSLESSYWDRYEISIGFSLSLVVMAVVVAVHDHDRNLHP